MAIHIERAGERFGPYSATEVRRHLAKGYLVANDLAWREGMTEWQPLRELYPDVSPQEGSTGALTAGTKPPAPARTGRNLVIVSLLTVVVAIWYLAFPYYSLWRLSRVLDAADREGIGQRVDFPAVRKGLKKDVAAYFDEAVKQRSTGKDDPLGDMVGAIAIPFAESMIDSMVTPEAVAKLIVESKSPKAEEGSSMKAGQKSARASDPRIEWSKVDYAFFTSMTHFLLDIEGVKLSMDLTGSGWKVVRVQLSPELLESAMK